MDTPRFLTRFLFWLLLGWLSTFFAEFLSGSAPGFLLDLFGYVGIFPIYCLHTLLLASLITRSTRPFSLRSLYFISLLFGMYEAYITKVLWQPNWNPDTFRIANIAVAETTLLVFFWHAVFSFMIPLYIGETLLTHSRRLQGLLPLKWQKRAGKNSSIIGLGFVASILFGTAAANLEDAILLSLINCGAASLAILAWRNLTHKKRFDLADLLPRKLEFAALAFLLLLVYINFGFNLNRHVHAGVLGHTAILLMYAFIIILATLSIRRDTRSAISVETAPATSATFFSLKHWFLFCGALISGAILINLLPQVAQDLIASAILLAYTGLGVFFLLSSIHSLLKSYTIRYSKLEKIHYD